MKKYIKSAKQGAPDINSYVYNALSDVAFNLTQDGYDVNKSEFRNAVNNFMRKFFADDASLDYTMGATEIEDDEYYDDEDEDEEYCD